MNQLHPGVKWLFRVRGYSLFVFFSVFFGIWSSAFFGIILAAVFGFSSLSLAVTIISFAVFLFILMFVLVETYTRMSYNRWFYEFNEDGLKLERGIIWKRYSNVPYERIQNVDIHRGIIARIFGFSTIMIQTAGYSGQPQVEGYIPGVEMGQAEKIREFVMKKIKQTSRGKQGL